MNKSAVSYFVQKFGAYDTEELGDLVSRRLELSDEAVEAFGCVLSAKGLKESDIFIAPQPAQPPTPEQEGQNVETQTKDSRELWLGVAANSSSPLLPIDVSPRSIIFWRHLVVIAFILGIAPPYFGRTLTEFAGGVLGKLIVTLVSAGVFSALGLLFFTKTLKGRCWWFFIECAWCFGAIAIFLSNYGTR
jgi:hypothetical protein